MSKRTIRVRAHPRRMGRKRVTVRRHTKKIRVRRNFGNKFLNKTDMAKLIKKREEEGIIVLPTHNAYVFHNPETRERKVIFESGKKNFGFRLTAKRIGTNINYGDGDLQIETAPNKWKSLGPAQKTFGEISDQTGVEITFADLFFGDQDQITEVIRRVHPETKGWRIKQVDEPIIELKDEDDETKDSS